MFFSPAGLTGRREESNPERRVWQEAGVTFRTHKGIGERDEGRGPRGEG